MSSSTDGTGGEWIKAALPLTYGIRDERHKVVCGPNLIYSVTIYERPANDSYPKEYREYKWKPIFDGFKNIMEVIVSCVHSLFVRQILNTWSSQN